MENLNTSIQRTSPETSLESSLKVAKAMAASGYFKDATDANKALVKILVGAEFGLGPAASMMGISIVEGKPQLGANLIASLVKSSRTYGYEVKRLTAEECVIVFKRGSEILGESSYTIQEARVAKLANKFNWTAYPKNMMFARAMSNGAKWFCPDVFSGVPVYYEGEFGEPVETPPVETPAEVVASEPAKPMPTQKNQSVQPKPGLISPDQVKRLYTIARKTGYTDAGVHELMRSWNYEHSAEITTNDYPQIIASAENAEHAAYYNPPAANKETDPVAAAQEQLAKAPDPFGAASQEPSDSEELPAAPADRTKEAPATEKQMVLIEKLISIKPMDEDDRKTYVECLQNGLTKKEASMLIDELQQKAA